MKQFSLSLSILLFFVTLFISSVPFLNEENTYIANNVALRDSIDYKKTYTQPYDWVEENKFIAHGMGAIDQYRVTNSLEAFQENYAKGHRVFEVDFVVTSDDQLFARHDWLPYTYDRLEQKPPNNNPNQIPTLAQIDQLKIHKNYHSLSLKEIIDLMEKYPDIYIVTDTKSDENKKADKMFQLMVDTIKEQEKSVINRIIPQIYNEQMLSIIKSHYDFENIIYTLYQSKSNNQEVLDFALNNQIKVVTMPEGRYSQEFVSELSSHGIATYIHTINDKNSIGKYIKSDVHGVYTDFITPQTKQKSV